MKESFEILKNIEAADAPPFLLTRIQAKIQQQLKERVSKKQAIACFMGLVIIVSINVFVLSTKKENSSNSDLITEMNLSPSNQLYE